MSRAFQMCNNDTIYSFNRGNDFAGLKIAEIRREPDELIFSDNRKLILNKVRMDSQIVFIGKFVSRVICFYCG
jgi:hypothetical protein